MIALCWVGNTAAHPDASVLKRMSLIFTIVDATMFSILPTTL